MAQNGCQVLGAQTRVAALEQERRGWMSRSVLLKGGWVAQCEVLRGKCLRLGGGL